VPVDASERFLEKLAGVTDPETKRKAIGVSLLRFSTMRRRIAEQTGGVDWLVQGTLVSGCDRVVERAWAVADDQEPSQCGRLPET
jgi:GMP synthase PP-ATPase subunit